MKVTAAVGSRCEIRAVHSLLVQLSTGVGNWVEKGKLDLPSNENPCSGEERLPLFVVFGLACKKCIVFVGVSDALGLVRQLNCRWTH